MTASSPRVIHVIASLHTYGAQRMVAALSSAMPDEFDVAVMTMYSSDHFPPNGLRGRIFDIARNRERDWTFFERMVRTIRAWRPSIVHTHMHNGKYWGRLAAIAAGVRVIVHTEHNSDFRAPVYVQIANRALHSRTARIVTFSQHHAQRLARAEHVSPSKLAVIPNGIDPIPARLSREAVRESIGADPERIVVLHIGRFETVKNQGLAVEAVASLPELRSRCQLFFVGSGPDEKMVRALVAERGLRNAVRFLGFRDDVRDLLEAADVVVMTSLNEAMPMVAIEAMMAGVPIVTVPWDGSAAFFNDGSLAEIAESYAPEHLAIALRRVLDDERFTIARVRAAKDLALTEYSLEACARRHADLYKTLLDGALVTAGAS
jgi:glycosyltransferase involved in cell wall biosynthesis